VITNNCNHFTDRVAMFLVGHHVPDEVLRQPNFLLKSKFVRVIRPMMNWWLRDRIAAREKGKDIPMPGRGRIQPTEHVEIGTVVVVHPAESGGGLPILGHVLGAETPHPQNSSAWPAFLDYCSCNSACKLDQISVLGECSTESAPKGTIQTSEACDGFWFQYFELGKLSSATPSMAQVRMELFPRSRLSLAATRITDDNTAQAAYAEALMSMGVDAPPPPCLAAIKNSSNAVPGMPILKELPLRSPRPTAAATAVPGPFSRNAAASEEVIPDTELGPDRGMRILPPAVLQL